MPVEIMKARYAIVADWPPLSPKKLISDHTMYQSQLTDGKSNVRLITPSHISTNCENMAMIGTVNSEIISGLRQFLRLATIITSL